VSAAAGASVNQCARAVHDQGFGLVRGLAGDIGKFVDGQVGQVVAGV
jgi:hypothetical protein